MRKIERLMLAAIVARKSVTLGNTRVEYLPAIDSPTRSRIECAKVYLFGNHIASFTYAYNKFDCNPQTFALWPTATTKSRLRAMGIPAMKYTADEITVARWRLTRFVIEKAQEYTKKLGVTYVPAAHAPETLAQIAYHMRQSQYHGRPFPVWDGASENTIYMNAGGNYAFRFWHDALHYMLSMDTSLVDELELGAMHTGVVMAHFGFDSLEAKLMRADTMGQSRYAADHAGNFPEHQLAFVLKCIEDM